MYQLPKEATAKPREKGVLTVCQIKNPPPPARLRRGDGYRAGGYWSFFSVALRVLTVGTELFSAEETPVCGRGCGVVVELAAPLCWYCP